VTPFRSPFLDSVASDSQVAVDGLDEGLWLSEAQLGPAVG